MEDKIIKKKVLSTIAYYHELCYPLTAFEIWKNIIQLRENGDGKSRCSLLEIIEVLEDDKMQRWIESYRGFYFLKGHKKSVKTRIQRSKIAGAKLKKLRKYIFWMRMVPFVRMIAVTGRLAMKNTEYKSDWDLLIVLQRRRIWLGRTLVTLFAEIVGKRRKRNKVTDRICLNYFITEDSLEIGNKDLYAANEYSFIFPLFGEEIFSKFQNQNEWINEYKPNRASASVSNLKILRDNLFFNTLQKIGETIFDWDILEKKLRDVEKKRIENNPLTSKEGSLIEASDRALIFLPEPQGPKIFEKFKDSIERLVIKNRMAF